MTAPNSASGKSQPRSGIQRRVIGGPRTPRRGTIRGHSSGLEQFRFTHLPFVTLAANWATRENVLVPNAQECVEFAVDADIDVLLRMGAGEMQPFHAGLRVLRRFRWERIVSSLACRNDQIGI